MAQTAGAATASLSGPTKAGRVVAPLRPAPPFTDLRPSESDDAARQLIGCSALLALPWVAADGPGAVAVLRNDKPQAAPPTLPTLRGHAAAVVDLEFRPVDACTSEGLQRWHLVTGGEDGLVKVWDVTEEGVSRDTYSALLTMEGHVGHVSTVNFHPHDHDVYSGGLDNTFRAWDLEAKAEKHVYTCHRDAVRSVAWSPDGLLCVTASRDKRLRVLDPRSASVVSETTCGELAPELRVVWLLRSNMLCVVGSSPKGEHQLRLHDARKLPVVVSKVDVGVLGGAPELLYDATDEVVLVAGRGGTSLKGFEVYAEQQAPGAFPCLDHRFQTPHEALALASICPPHEPDTLRLHRLTGEGTIEPLVLQIRTKQNVLRRFLSNKDTKDAPRNPDAEELAALLSGSIPTPQVLSSEDVAYSPEPAFPLESPQGSEDREMDALLQQAVNTANAMVEHERILRHRAEEGRHEAERRCEEAEREKLDLVRKVMEKEEQVLLHERALELMRLGNRRRAGRFDEVLAVVDAESMEQGVGGDDPVSPAVMAVSEVSEGENAEGIISFRKPITPAAIPAGGSGERQPGAVLGAEGDEEERKLEVQLLRDEGGDPYRALRRALAERSELVSRIQSLNDVVDTLQNRCSSLDEELARTRVERDEVKIREVHWRSAREEAAVLRLRINEQERSYRDKIRGKDDELKELRMRMARLDEAQRATQRHPAQATSSVDAQSRDKKKRYGKPSDGPSAEIPTQPSSQRVRSFSALPQFVSDTAQRASCMLTSFEQLHYLHYLHMVNPDTVG